MVHSLLQLSQIMCCSLSTVSSKVGRQFCVLYVLLCAQVGLVNNMLEHFISDQLLKKTEEVKLQSSPVHTQTLTVSRGWKDQLQSLHCWELTALPSTLSSPESSSRCSPNSSSFISSSGIGMSSTNSVAGILVPCGYPSALKRLL